MDLVSQVALGAAVGEGVLGRRVGRRAPVWGGAVPRLSAPGAEGRLWDRILGRSSHPARILGC